MGTWIKYIPEPVVTGFTAGIAVIIFSSQIKDLFGLTMDEVPAEFFAKWAAFWDARDTVNMANVAVAAASLALIIGLRRYAPKIPGFLVAVVGGAVVTAAFGLPIDTIGSRFGGIPATLPTPQLPEITIARVQELLPSAFTIAFLAGVESLLSAVVADGMTGRRHRSNCELVAQGVANSASALFGGMPATGAIARTATNIRSGAKSPVAGMLHAAFVLVFMLLFAPLANSIPLASLAPVLVIVAWNMSEIDRFRHLMTGPWGDRIVLLLTFGLTVAGRPDGCNRGRRRAGGDPVHAPHDRGRRRSAPRGQSIIEEDEDDFGGAPRSAYTQRADLPPGVEVFQMRGPLFFGVASRISDVIERIAGSPRVFILRMREVPMIDATGASKMAEFVTKCHRHGTALIISGLQPQPEGVLRGMQVLNDHTDIHLVASFDEAIALAHRLTGNEAGTQETREKETREQETGAPQA